MAVVSAQAYETSIINTLAASDPQMNTALGTPVRKIITAVAQEMAAYNVDVNVTTTLYSIDAVSGTELDYLVGQFGFTRQAAQSARGTVSVHRDNGDSKMTFEYGTYFYKPESSTSESIAFQSTAYQEMDEGVLSCDIAIVAVQAGSLGNVPANTITTLNGTTDYMYITNVNPTSGGRDEETDEQLRQRFLLTVFRNIAGTKDQLSGLALAHAQVSKSALVAQESRYSETVQVVVMNNIATASVSDAKWELDVDHPLDVERRYWVRIADTQELLSFGDYEVSLDGKLITFHPRQGTETIGPVTEGAILGLPYSGITSATFVDNATKEVVPASCYELDLEAGQVTVIKLPDSSSSGDSWDATFSYNFLDHEDFVQIEFDYFSKHNRGHLKSVELFVDSLTPANVIDIQYLDLDKLITNENRTDWVREDGTNPPAPTSAEKHVYIPLSYQPMLSSSGYISAGTSMVLQEGTHYRRLYDATKTAGSARGMDAIEFIGTVQGSGNNRRFVFSNSVGVSSLAHDAPLSIPYLYDYPIAEVQSLVDAQRVVTMDVQVHEAKHRYFVIFLTLMFSAFPREATIEAVRENIMSWAEMLPFGPTIQLSDIETVAANTSGVDNVRTATQYDAGNKAADGVTDLATGTSPLGYGVIEIQRDGETFKRRFTNDFVLAENEVFEVQDVVVYSRSQQRWG